MILGSPKEWRRHLEGCANLLEAVGINGFVGGVEEALFWCFIRMGKLYNHYSNPSADQKQMYVALSSPKT